MISKILKLYPINKNSLKYPMARIYFNHIEYYPTSLSLSYIWSFGSLAGFCLIVQILTGVFLAMHYSADIINAYSSVEHIMRDVNYGWLGRYVHSNGASMFFFIIYLHIARGLFYKSYAYESRMPWITGLIIFILMMATAFIGYVLPWGQMSLWGATVITNLFSAIPFIGDSLVTWLWGGYSVSKPTLSRFYSLHFLLPFIIILFMIIHLSELHERGSSHPFPLNYRLIDDYIFFYPFYYLKDVIGLFMFFLIYFIFVYFYPDLLGHSDNYIEANFLITPEHIVPEWYFLPFYAILRSIPDKLLGVLFMFGAIFIFFLIPFFNKLSEKFVITTVLQKRNAQVLEIISETFLTKDVIVFLFYITFILLGYIGSMPVEEPYISIGFFLTMLYFKVSYMFVNLPGGLQTATPKNI